MSRGQSANCVELVKPNENKTGVQIAHSAEEYWIRKSTPEDQEPILKWLSMS